MLTDATMLALVRLIHTIVYVVNGSACFVVLFAGVTGQVFFWLWVAVALVAIEAAILLINGLRCPLSAVAVKYGANDKDFIYDTFIPERLTRYTVAFFSSVVLIGLAAGGLHWAGFWA